MLLLCAVFLCGGFAGIPIGHRIAFLQMSRAQAQFQSVMKVRFEEMQESFKRQTDALHQKVSEHERDIATLNTITRSDKIE